MQSREGLELHPTPLWHHQLPHTLRHSSPRTAWGLLQPHIFKISFFITRTEALGVQPCPHALILLVLSLATLFAV